MESHIVGTTGNDQTIEKIKALLPEDLMLRDDESFASFSRLKEKVLAKRPILRDVLSKHGDETLLDYANDYVDVNLNPPIVQRQSQLLSTVHEATEERFGQRIADGVVAQLEKYYFVSTADHMGPITHPFFVNSNLLTALTMDTHSDPVLQYVIVLACSNISLNNSCFPRGLLFNTYAKEKDELHLQRLSFLPSNSHSASVYNFRPYTKEEITKVKSRLRELVKIGEVPPNISEKIEGLVEEIYNSPEAFECENYREQVAKTNRHLWNKFFSSTDIKMPQLIYLDQEDIVVRLLIKYHLTQDTVINHILFDAEYEPFINNYFEGIFGTFSRKDATGTYLFWALPEGSKINKQLWRRGNYLTTEDGSFKVELNPEALKEALESRKLIPSLLLNFITISFYYGLKCLGGFSQVNYLTLMKNSFIKMNVDLGNYRSIEVCARAQTKEICCGLTLAFLGYNQGKVALASGLDLILYGDKDSWDKLAEISKQMTLDEALNPLMPEIYRISYDEKEWEEDLLKVTEKEINKLTGLDKKVKPCVDIPV